MNWLISIIAFLLGLSIGSFCNVCIYRLPLRKSIILPRSYCPLCEKQIAWYDNIPLFSFLILKGRCRHCRGPISIQYPLVELLVGLLFVVAYLSVGSRGLSSILIPFFWYFCASLVVLSVIDWKHFIIPDVVIYPLILLGFILAAVLPRHLDATGIIPALLRALLGASVGGLSLWLIGVLGRAVFKKEAMGLGDVKLMAAVGAWQGWQMVLLAIFLGALVASVVGVTFIILKKAQWGSRIPFGPFLAAGSLITLFFGWEILFWYLGLY
ncbi:MAG: prepilin peptidase [Candidatus Euphemobacter frigidus]|nr:prepilin peptidase [Candidatus Euphemobacter frigidus]MDP8275765.1 prepilin peptidase [Candidatus Euphemobacter frigidus]